MFLGLVWPFCPPRWTEKPPRLRGGGVTADQLILDGRLDVIETLTAIAGQFRQRLGDLTDAQVTDMVHMAHGVHGDAPTVCTATRPP